MWFYVPVVIGGVYALASVVVGLAIRSKRIVRMGGMAAALAIAFLLVALAHSS